MGDLPVRPAHRSLDAVTADYDFYEERQIEPTPIFWATLKEWSPPSEGELVWLVLEGEIERRFANAIKAISAST
jgi:hypothetical protein